MKTHHLKIESCYFNAVADGRKTFELRKNDREYKVGDTLTLCELDRGVLTGGEIEATISYVLEGCPQYGLQEGYAILGLRLYMRSLVIELKSKGSGSVRMEAITTACSSAHILETYTRMYADEWEVSILSTF